MPELTVLAPAKINLHLEVLGLRADGFHELAMVMQSLDLVDRLVLNPTADGQISLRCDKADLPTDGSNLIVRAAELLRARSGLPELGARIDLEKRIPIGAGLAGGSSDGAAALVGLNALWGCGFAMEELRAMATALGSDMPFCLEGGTQLCFGRGERLEPLELAQPPSLGVLLIKHPQASVSTPWAYGRCREMRGDFYLEHEADFAQRRDALRAQLGERRERAARRRQALAGELERTRVAHRHAVEAPGIRDKRAIAVAPHVVDDRRDSRLDRRIGRRIEGGQRGQRGVETAGTAVEGANQQRTGDGGRALSHGRPPGGARVRRLQPAPRCLSVAAASRA